MRTSPSATQGVCWHLVGDLKIIYIPEESAGKVQDSQRFEHCTSEGRRVIAVMRDSALFCRV